MAMKSDYLFSKRNIAILMLSFFIIALFVISTSAAHAELMEEWMDEFRASDFDFQRASSTVPFIPIAFFGMKHYGDQKLEFADQNKTIKFDQSTVSQAAGIPFLMSSRDILALGEYISWTHFDSHSSDVESFEVVSIGFPVGWLRQASPDLQLAGFVFPLGHKSTLDNSSWEWELMAGGFARFIQTERLWWTLGVYVDVGMGDDLILPYAGASWAIDEHWTVSAVFPWPAVLYAPNKNSVFRFGVMPSGSSWSVENSSQGEMNYNLDAWDLGISYERRLKGNIWGKIEAGVGGLRGLKISNGNWESPDHSISSTPYISIGIDYRPEI